MPSPKPHRAIASTLMNSATMHHAARGGSRLPDWGTLTGITVALMICLPLFAVLWLAFFPEENIWPHLFSTVLPQYVRNTLILMCGVAGGTLLIGVSTAWLVTHYDFSGRNLFVWCLLLPFAVPAYVIAFIYTELLEFSGPLQTMLRSAFGWSSVADYYFPSIRSIGGAICMMVLVLYPYVYLLARSAFLEQSESLIEAAAMLGQPRRKSFFSISLPMARPAIVVGVAMALMETLNDFGTVDYFAVSTLTVGIFDVWQNMGNLSGAAQISCLLLFFVLLLLFVERFGRKHQKLVQPSASRFRRSQRVQLSGWQHGVATLWCALPIVLGFVIPLLMLSSNAIRYFDVSWTPEFRKIAINTLLLSLAAAVLAVSLGIFLAYITRIKSNRWLLASARLASCSYALPGAVLALGIMIPFAAIDNGVDAFMREHFNISTGLILSGTVWVLLSAYVVRFLAVAFGSVESSLTKITPSMDMAARSLGEKPLSMLWHVHIPLMRSGIVTALLVVFVDCMKELPATLLLRPFNFETLATHVYHLASDELIEQSSLAALLIVLTGLIPVIVLSLTLDRGNSLVHKHSDALE